MNNAQDKDNGRVAKVRSNLLVSLIITVTFALIPGIIDNFELGSKLSIILLSSIGLLAIGTLLLAFKYPDWFSVVENFLLTVGTQKRVKNFFVSLILAITVLSGAMFYGKYSKGTSTEFTYNSLIELKANNCIIADEMSKLVSTADSVIDKHNFHSWIRQLLETTERSITREFNFCHDENLKVTVWKKISHNGRTYLYEQNWTGGTTSKCFRCNSSSIIGCSERNQDVFTLYKPDFADGDLAAWDIENQALAHWSTEKNALVFTSNAPNCAFNTTKGDYKRTGLICYYSKFHGNDNQVGICLDFYTPKQNIYYSTRIKQHLVELTQKIMLFPAAFYAESAFEDLSDVLQGNCLGQN